MATQAGSASGHEKDPQGRGNIYNRFNLTNTYLLSTQDKVGWPQTNNNPDACDGDSS